MEQQTATIKENKFGKKMQNLWDATKNDFTTKNSDFRYIAIKMGIIALSLIVSLFWAPFSYVVLLEAIVFSCFQLDGRALYYIVFIMPFMQVFRCRPDDTYFLLYECVAVVSILGVKLLIDFVKKKKKINWFFTISFALLLIYFSIPRGNGSSASRYWGSIVIGMSILFVAYYYGNDLDFKELVFSFVMGFLLTCSLEIFRDISRLPTMVGVFYSYGRKFTAGYINPNVLMGEGAVCLALIMALFLNGKLRVLFYPLLIIISVCVLSTLSKVGLVVVLLCYAVFLILLCARRWNKRRVIKIIISVLVMVATLGACHTQIDKCRGRLQNSLKSPSEVTGVENRDTTSDNVVIVGGKEVNLTELSTGRFDIWKSYFNKIFESPKNTVFGCGIGAPFIGEWQGDYSWQPHNTFIQALYYVGIFGYLLMILWFISAIDKEKLKKFNWYSLLVVLATGIYLCDVEFFSFRLAIYVLLICYGLISSKESFIMAEKEENIEITAVQKNRIPRKIHYIWLGGKPLPKIAEECIKSWEKYCPDYEIKRWDESNLNIDCCQYCREAYDAKKYAFASDVLRFDILSREGGVYLDTDVELLKPIDELLQNSCFMGFETMDKVAPGLILGSISNGNTINNIYELYKKDKFVSESGSLNLTTICTRTTNYLLKRGLLLDNSKQIIDEVTIYPTEYFCPLSPITNKKNITSNTYAIHWYYASWYNKKAKLKKEMKKIANFITNGWFGITLYKIKQRRTTN